MEVEESEDNSQALNKLTNAVVQPQGPSKIGAQPQEVNEAVSTNIPSQTSSSQLFPQKSFCIALTSWLIPAYRIVDLGLPPCLAPMNFSKTMFSIWHASFGSIWQHSSNKESSNVVMTRTFLNWSCSAKLLGYLYQPYMKLDRIKSIPLITSLSSPRSSLSSLGTNPLCNLHQSMIIEQQELTMSCHLFPHALARKQGKNQKRHSSNITKP